VSDEVFHLAQLNIGRLLAPIDSPLIADFVGALDRINALGEAVERLEHMRAHGPSPHAFTIRESWPAAGTAADVVTDDRWTCPTG
jgi:hypothetical protein